MSKQDLAKKFNDWYVAQPGNSIGEILSNIDPINKQDGHFVYNYITIKIHKEFIPEVGVVKSYSGRVYYTNDENNIMRSELRIDFTSDGWKYTDDNNETYYFNENGPINNIGYVLNPNGIERVQRNGVSDSMTRSGTVYNRLGGRKSRKSRKSRKNKKQKNRKTNRR